SSSAWLISVSRAPSIRKRVTEGCSCMRKGLDWSPIPAFYTASRSNTGRSESNRCLGTFFPYVTGAGIYTSAVCPTRQDRGGVGQGLPDWGVVGSHAGNADFSPGLLEIRQYSHWFRRDWLDYQLARCANDLLAEGVHWHSSVPWLAGHHSVEGGKDGPYCRRENAREAGFDGRVLPRDGAGENCRAPDAQHPGAHRGVHRRGDDRAQRRAVGKPAADGAQARLQPRPSRHSPGDGQPD